MKNMKIRAHHLLCLPRSESDSYDEKSSKRITEIQNLIKDNSNMKIKIINKEDYLCEACPFYKNKKCQRKSKLNYKKLDDNVLRILNIKPGEILPANC